MTREKILEGLMINKYGSVLNFSKEIGIPYTTIKSMLTRGIGKTGIDKIIVICNALNISPNTLAEFEQIPENDVYQEIILLLSKYSNEDLNNIRDFILKYNGQSNIPYENKYNLNIKNRNKVEDYIRLLLLDQNRENNNSDN